MLEAVWKSDRAVTVRHVQLAFPDLAYTTLMKILDRLYRKGMLLRRRRERAFAYEPRCPREAFFGEVVSGQVLELLGAGGISTAILSTIVHTVGRVDVTLLDELDALVRAERRRLGVEET